MTIQFGTSGWRAIIADGFTFDRLSLVVQAIARLLRREDSLSRGVVVGYDTRFLSGAFAEEAAHVLSQNGIPVFLSSRDVPTPCIAFTILHRKALGGINISASHNPPEYGGIKFSPAYGGPAGTDITRQIEAEIRSLLEGKTRRDGKRRIPGKIRRFDPASPYLEHLKSLIRTDVLREGRLRLVVDCLNGTSRGYLDRFLSDEGRAPFVLRTGHDPTFGWKRPDPAKENLSELIREVRRQQAHLGLATDGDADRFGIVDRGGVFMPANHVLSLILEYLIQTRPRARTVARTVATTHQIDAIAKAHGLEVVETPVGFKYIGEVLSKGECLLGGEESAGLSIRHHVPEKDGILACLLVAEMVASRKKSLREIQKALMKRYGPFYSARMDLALTPKAKEALLSRLEREAPSEIGRMNVLKENRADGFKFYLEGERWILLRPSGTEPLVRVYLEARSRRALVSLKKDAKRLIRRLTSRRKAGRAKRHV